MLSGFIRIVFCGLFHELQNSGQNSEGASGPILTLIYGWLPALSKTLPFIALIRLETCSISNFFYRLKRASPLLFDLCDTQTGGSVAQQGDIDQPLDGGGRLAKTVDQLVCHIKKRLLPF